MSFEARVREYLRGLRARHGRRRWQRRRRERRADAPGMAAVSGLDRRQRERRARTRRQLDLEPLDAVSRADDWNGVGWVQDGP